MFEQKIKETLRFVTVHRSNAGWEKKLNKTIYEMEYNVHVQHEKLSY